MKKKITLLISLLIILNAPISAYAQATSTTPTVTIAAGSGAAVGGVYNQNGSKTAMAATALTLAVLSATGATVKLTEASIQAGKTVYQVINDKFAQWVGGTSAEDLTNSEAEELQSRFKVITGGGGDPEDPDNDQNNGTNIGEDGKLWFSPGSLAMLKKFTDFLQSQDDGIMVMPEASGTDQTVNGTWYGSVYDLNDTYNLVFHTNNTTSSENMNLVNVGMFQIKRNDGKFQLVPYLKGSQFRSSRVYKNNGNWDGGNSLSVYSVGDYYYILNNISYTIWPDVYLFEDGSASDYLNSLNGEWDVQNGTAEITTDGIYGNSDWNNNLLNNPNNQSLVVDPGILPYINPTTDQQISIPDYLQLLIDQAQANATDQNQPINLPSIDPATLEEHTVEVPVIRSDPISEPAPSEPADPIATPDNPVQNPEEVPSPEEAVELMKVDLTRIFPFCIPWDLYRLIAKFNAEPVTPTLTIDWGNILGSLGIDYETTIDLHDYDGVAQVLRTMETVAFVVGLAVATRSIFLQS